MFSWLFLQVNPLKEVLEYLVNFRAGLFKAGLR